MGGRLAGGTARQHPDLTARDRPLLTAVALGLFAVDGVLSAVLATFFLPLRIGVVPFPISAVLSGLLNAALVWAAMQWTASNMRAALPLWAWLATVGLFVVVGGPGGDIVFASTWLGMTRLLVLLIFGAGPAVALLRRRRPLDPTRP